MATFKRRITQAEKIAHEGFATFEKAIRELEIAADLQKKVHDDIQAEIDRLSVMAGEAEHLGRSAQRKVEKLREFFAE